MTCGDFTQSHGPIESTNFRLQETRDRVPSGPRRDARTLQRTPNRDLGGRASLRRQLAPKRKLHRTGALTINLCGEGPDACVQAASEKQLRLEGHAIILLQRCETHRSPTGPHIPQPQSAPIHGADHGTHLVQDPGTAVCLESGEVEWMELEGNSKSGTSTAFLEQLREKPLGH